MAGETVSHCHILLQRPSAARLPRAVEGRRVSVTHSFTPERSEVTTRRQMQARQYYIFKTSFPRYQLTPTEHVTVSPVHSTHVAANGIHVASARVELKTRLKASLVIWLY